MAYSVKVVIIEQFLAGGSIPEDWPATILKCIPKSILAETPDKHWPLALQNTKVKWVSAVMQLQIQDVLQAITPSSQKGFVRGRQMVEHAIEAVDFWGRNRRCVVVAIDFQEAYDSVQHSFVQAMPRYLLIGHNYIAMLMQLLTAELIIEVCGEVVPTAVVRPRSGVRQGDPLSPALFSALTLALVYDVSRLHADVEILLYADDMLLFFRGSGRRAVGNMEAVLYVLGIFGHYSGLTINRGKSYALVKTRLWECPTHIAGLQVQQMLKYLGVLLVHVSPSEACGPAISKMMLQARHLSTLPLPLEEKTALLQMWISPCCYLTARVRRPNLHVERQMNVIQAPALSMSCWGLTRGILAEPASSGGVEMASLAAYVQWVHSHSFVLFAQGVFRLSRGLTQPFEDFAHFLGLTYNSATLRYLQLSPVVKRPPRYLGGSLRSYSEVRKGIPIPPPPPSMRTAVMGLWHNAMFRNVQRQTYAHMPSVNRGSVLWEHLVQSEVLQIAAVQTMAPTFRLKYPSVVQTVLAVQSGGAQWRADAPCNTGKWAQAWRLRSLLLAATKDRMIFRPTGDRVWNVFSRLRVPSFDRDFIRLALWRKLTVAQRLYAMTRQDNCPFEPLVQTHQHFFEACQFTEFLGSSIKHTHGQVELEGGGWVAVKHLPYRQSELSLTTTQGLVYWAGLATAWALRCQRLFTGTLFTLFFFGGFCV